MSDRQMCRTCFCLGYDLVPVNGEWSCMEHLNGRDAAAEIVRLNEQLAERTLQHQVQLDNAVDLTARLAAAEAARGIAEQQLTVICDGVNRRCGADNHQLPLVSLDRLLASHERDLAECRRLLREACIAYENNFDDATSDKRLRRIGVFHTWYERAARAAGGCDEHGIFDIR